MHVARIRTIKPDFFRHYDLYLAEKACQLPLRIAFAGLWTACDREGRFKWNAMQLKLDCLPYDDVDFEEVLGALCDAGFVHYYEVDGQALGCVPSWNKHQSINQREAQSTLPAPGKIDRTATPVHAYAVHSSVSASVKVPQELRETVFARDGNKCVRCQSFDDLSVDHIFPQCCGGTHAITNLRTLCGSCNSKRPTGGAALLADLKSDGLTFEDMPRMCMHIPAHGEGKGKEGKGREEKDRPASEPKFDPVAVLIALDVPEQLVRDWLKHRKTKPGQITQTVIDGIKREAGKAGISMSDALRTIIERNWRGFEAKWLTQSFNGSSKPGNHNYLNSVIGPNDTIREI